ncbi:MAG: helix-turn-helix transcriptional regulator [Candidatus Protochlamydia sp.]|nr:helix-turn-helix transcriptional regulator [Candidatus Protochlamydia sp.]
MTPYSIEYLGIALKKSRIKLGLSQRALAAKVGVPQSHISKIETGLVNLRASSLIELARSLELEIMLVPRPLVQTVLALQRDAGKTNKPRPMYRLDEDEDEQ